MYSFLILLFTLLSAASKEKTVDVITLEQLQSKAAELNNDTLYVVNFWATWCKPCVGEMPYFEAAANKFASRKVKIIFVSLNYAREQSMVLDFVKKKKIQPDVYLLNAGNPNNWIDKIEPEWNGSIPATIIYKHAKKVFFREGEFTSTELDSIIQTINK